MLKTRTIFRHVAVRLVVYPILLLMILYTAHFVTDLIIPAETTDEHRAQAAAYLKANNLPTPDNPFLQDGCTLFPDRLPWHDFRAVCLSHDIAYWAGGSNERQKRVNKQFREDISTTGPLGPVLAWPMYIGVAYFGDNGISRVVNSHWGFGWD